VVSSKGDDDLGNRVLGVIASGNVQEKTVHSEARAWSFFDLKGDLEVLLKSLSLPLHRICWLGAAQRSLIPHYYHPSVSAEFRLADRSSGILGQIHPSLCDQYKIKQPVFLVEIGLGAWLQSVVEESSLQELMRFPAVQRDLSIVVDRTLDYGIIESSILNAGISELRKCFPFDIYTGEKLPTGKKSISISIVYQAVDRTLTDDEVARYHESITRLLNERLGAQLRA
jgi:phenylalanyl-tRNA synthetase beta chain